MLITPEQFKEEMERVSIKFFGDTQECHIVMDDIMCKALKQLGYGDGIKIFEDTPKWYA